MNPAWIAVLAFPIAFFVAVAFRVGPPLYRLLLSPVWGQVRLFAAEILLTIFSYLVSRIMPPSPQRDHVAAFMRSWPRPERSDDRRNCPECGLRMIGNHSEVCHGRR